MPNIHADKVFKTGNVITTHALSVQVGEPRDQVIVVLAMGSKEEINDLMDQVIEGNKFRDMLSNDRKMLTTNWIGDNDLPPPSGGIRMFNLETKQWFRDAYPVESCVK
jgi:hypothetical protein